MLNLPCLLKTLALPNRTLINVENVLSFPHLIKHNLCELLPQVEASSTVPKFRDVPNFAIVQTAFIMKDLLQFVVIQCLVGLLI